MGKKNVNAGYVTTFNEHGIVSENRVTKIPKKKDKYLDYLLLGCTASTAIGSVKKADLKNKEKKILVSGCGAIGIYIIKYLKQLGFKNLTGLDIKLKKLNFAIKNGCSITINSKSGEEKFFVEDGIVEFKNNNLSVLTSSIFNLKNIDKSKIQDLIKLTEEETNKAEISDQAKFLADQKIDVLRSIN